jgi:hypothetical protein
MIILQPKPEADISFFVSEIIRRDLPAGFVRSLAGLTETLAGGFISLNFPAHVFTSGIKDGELRILSVSPVAMLSAAVVAVQNEKELQSKSNKPKADVILYFMVLLLRCFMFFIVSDLTRMRQLLFQ